MIGTTVGEEFDAFASEHKLRLEEVKTIKQIIEKLLAGRNDFFISDHMHGMLAIKETGAQGQIVSLPHPISTTDVFFALSRQSPCLALVPQINAVIEKSKQDGTLQAIVDKYIK